MSKAEIENLILKSFDTQLNKDEQQKLDEILKSTYWRAYIGSIQQLRGLARNQSPIFSRDFSNKLFTELESRSTPKNQCLSDSYTDSHLKNHSAGYSCSLVNDFFSDFTQKTQAKYNHWLYYFSMISKFAAATLIVLILFHFMIAEEQTLKYFLGQPELAFDRHMAYALFIQN